MNFYFPGEEQRRVSLVKNLTKFTELLRVGLRIQTLGSLSPKSMLLPLYHAPCLPSASGPPRCGHLLGLCCLPISRLPVPCEVPAGKRHYPQLGQLRSLSKGTICLGRAVLKETRRNSADLDVTGREMAGS